MGRKKNKAAGPGDKSGRIKLPKQIGGVKIPKELRQQGEALIAVANSPAGRGVIAAGIASVVASAMRPAPASRPAASVIVDDKPAKPRVDPDQLIDALSGATTLALQRLLAKAAG